MKNSIKILMGLALLAIGSQAQALLITAPTLTECADSSTCWLGDSPVNPDATDVSGIVGVSGLVELYKAEVPEFEFGDVVEEGSFASSYETTFGPITNDPNDALISYVSGATISCPECFLLVKDGNNSPRWYIFDIGTWNGMDPIELQDFWLNTGAISHISIFGNAANVPEPGMIGLLAIGLIGVVVARRKMKV